MVQEQDVKLRFPARLQKLCKTWQRKAESSLKHRKKMLQLWASGYYDSGYTRNHTLNLMDRGISTVVPFLVEGNPRILIQTLVANYKPWSYTTQLALNFLIEKMNLAENVFIPVAINSMFGAGITRTSFVYDRLISEDNELIKAGTPTVDVVDDSHYIGDPSAKRRMDFTFEGDIYKLPTVYAKDFFARKDKFGNQIADYIQSDCKLEQDYNPREISQSNYNQDKLSLRDYTTFIDLYLRDSNTIVTIMPEGKKAVILREVEWDGPEGGPYDYLSYKYFPEEPIPLPPAWSWHDIDVTVNLLADKAKEQAENQKKVFAYSAGAEGDAKKIAAARNMQTICVEDVDAIKDIDLGGVNPLNLEWITFMENQHTKQGANPDVLGGRGAQAETLGQEQLIYSNATRIVNNMYTRFQSFMISVIHKLAWAFWTDPSLYIPVVKEVPGVGDLPVVFSQADMVGDFYDFIFKVIPYSTQRMSPEVRYSRLMQFLSQWILPTMQMAAMQGSTIDFPTVSRILADYAGLDSFNQWYVSAVPHELQAVPYQMQPLKSPGQGNDALGALDSSREANMQQQQAKTTGSPSGNAGQPKEQ